MARLEEVLDSEEVEHLHTLSPLSRIRRLKTLVLELPSESVAFRTVQDAISTLTIEVREPSDDLSEPIDYIPSSDYDVMLQDLHPDDLTHSVTRLLATEYLSVAPSAVQWPIVGGVWGKNHRVMVTISCQSRDRSKNLGPPLWIHFIGGTGHHTPSWHLLPWMPDERLPRSEPD